MRDETWSKGYGQLTVAFPDREMTEERAMARGSIYREYLDDLADAAWLYAVADAIRCDEWFPTVATLRRYAEAWVPPDRLLPPARRAPEEIGAGKAAAR